MSVIILTKSEQKRLSKLKNEQLILKGKSVRLRINRDIEINKINQNIDDIENKIAILMSNADKATNVPGISRKVVGRPNGSNKERNKFIIHNMDKLIDGGETVLLAAQKTMREVSKSDKYKNVPGHVNTYIGIYYKNRSKA